VQSAFVQQADPPYNTPIRKTTHWQTQFEQDEFGQPEAASMITYLPQKEQMSKQAPHSACRFAERRIRIQHDDYLKDGKAISDISPNFVQNPSLTSGSACCTQEDTGSLLQ